MKIITIYAILDSENNIVTTTYKESKAIALVKETDYKIIPCNGIVIV